MENIFCFALIGKVVRYTLDIEKHVMAGMILVMVLVVAYIASQIN